MRSVQKCSAGCTAGATCLNLEPCISSPVSSFVIRISIFQQVGLGWIYLDDPSISMTCKAGIQFIPLQTAPDRCSPNWCRSLANPLIYNTRFQIIIPKGSEAFRRFPNGSHQAARAAPGTLSRQKPARLREGRQSLGSAPIRTFRCPASPI